MALDQLIEQIRVERAQVAVYLQKLDSALSSLTQSTGRTYRSTQGGDRQGMDSRTEDEAQRSP